MERLHVAYLVIAVMVVIVAAWIGLALYYSRDRVVARQRRQERESRLRSRQP